MIASLRARACVRMRMSVKACESRLRYLGKVVFLFHFEIDKNPVTIRIYNKAMIGRKPYHKKRKGEKK